VNHLNVSTLRTSFVEPPQKMQSCARFCFLFLPKPLPNAFALFSSSPPVFTESEDFWFFFVQHLDISLARVRTRGNVADCVAYVRRCCG
jgi:hypothetical protein